MSKRLGGIIGCKYKTFGHGFDKIVYALLCGGDTKWLEIATYFFLQMGEICQSRQSYSSTYSRTTTSEAQTPTYVEVLPSPLSVDEHKSLALARMRYSLIFFVHHVNRITDRRRTKFADCQNSTTFELAPPGMRGPLGLE